jgi:hypothetical protein
MIGVGLASGCVPTDADLTIATDLPPDECRALEAAYASQPPLRIHWITVTPGTDPAGLAGSADLILRSAPVSPPRESDPLDWRPWRRADLGLIVDREAIDSRAMAVPGSAAELGGPAFAGLFTLDDPRRDGVSLALAQGLLASRPWAEGYSNLVRIAANAGPIGRGNSAAARVDRGEAAVAPGVAGAGSAGFVRVGPGPGAQAAVVPGSPHGDPARRFLDALTIEAPPGEEEPSRSTPLLADLLGATLVEAHDELLTASSALAGREGPEMDRLRSLLVEAPPWPPASIQELRRDDPTGALVEALAEQVAPGLEARYWLLQEWESSPRPLEEATLEAIAAAADGRLLREPRFRAWLRADWAAWARQRYRRVARQADVLAASRGRRP